MDMNEKEGLRVRRVAGGCMVEYPPLFSSDGNMLFIIYAKTIQAFSVTTGELLREYKNTANESDLVGMAIDNTNSKYIYGCTTNGLIISWKIDSGILCDRLEVLKQTKFVVESFDILYDHNGASSFLVLGTSTKRLFLQFCPRSNKILQVIYAKLHGPDNENDGNDKRIVLAPGGKGLNYFAFIAVKRWYWCLLKPTIYVGSRPHCSNVEPVVITCHPTEAIVALGDTLGRVVLYRNFLKEKNPVPETYHWHPHPVVCLAFSSNGTHFYSGGRERVLIKWNIGQQEKVDLIPRLPDTVLHVALGPENMTLVVCTADNGIQVFNALHKQTAIVQSFSKISTEVPADELFPAGLRVNPRMQAIVLNGRVGCIQFFSTYTKSLLYTLDITLRNYNTNEDRVMIHNTVVTNIGVSAFWLATIENWSDNEHSTETRLKFWKYDESHQTYSLNTNLENVHHGGVNDIQFSSSTRERDLLCATAGYDRRIKVWSLEAIETSDGGEKLVWTCVGSVHHRNLPVQSISFSQDASLLAGGFGNVLCTWNADTLHLKCALSAPSGNDGSVNRALVVLPAANKEGRGAKKASKQNSYEDLRNNITEDLVRLISGKGKCSFLENVNVKRKQHSRIVRSQSKYCTANECKRYKQTITEKVSGFVQMSMAQKIEMFHTLQIACRGNKDTRIIIRQKLLASKQSIRKVDRVLHKLTENMDVGVRFRSIRKVRNFERRKFSKATFDKIFEKVLPDQTKPQTNAPTKSRNVSAEALQSRSPKAEEKPMKSYAQIKKVLFCYGQFSHLLVMCTESRMIVWNLLSLKIQVSVLLTIDHIAHDPFTNLMAAFTKDNEIYIFLPNIPMPLYHRIGMPKVFGAVWIPRRYPRSQSFNVDWQATSQLFFLNEKQELLQLVSDSDEESLGPVVCMNESPLGPNTPFAAMLAKQANSVNANRGTLHPGMAFGSSAKSAVKDIISSSSHTMAPISLFCKDFLRSLLATGERRTKDKSQSSQQGKASLADGNDGTRSADTNGGDSASDAETTVHGNDDAETGTAADERNKVRMKVKERNGKNNRSPRTIHGKEVATDKEVELRKLLNEPIEITFL